MVDRMNGTPGLTYLYSNLSSSRRSWDVFHDDTGSDDSPVFNGSGSFRSQLGDARCRESGW